MRICCYGASSAYLDRIYLDSAFETGAKLAKKGVGVIYGAGKYGVMGAVGNGVISENGELIGIVPEFFETDGVVFEGCTRLIYTETMRERKQMMAEMADGFITLPGGIGTFEEFFETLTAKQLGFNTRPLVLLNINGIYDHLIELMDQIVAEGFLKEEGKALFYVTDSVDDAIEYVLNEANRISGKPEDFKNIITTED